MVKKFLKAKHWQLFFLMCGIPLIFQIITMGSMFLSMSTENNTDTALLSFYFSLYPLVMILLIGVFFGWFWSIAVGLDFKIPDTLKLKLSRFKIFLFIPLAYILLLSIFIGITMSGMDWMGNNTNPPAVFGIILPLHLLSMFCIFYCLYFVAKTIKTAELQKKVGFGDFAGEFFLIWFFPIGIWFIQPKLNKMIEE